MPGEVSALEQEVLASAAQVHAATASLLEALARFDEAAGWHGAGIRSLGHWCDINLGIGSRHARRLAGAMVRLEDLPELRAAFESGAVSVDKVLLVAPVATAATDAKFTTIAKAASVAQLQRICSAYRNLDEPDTPDAHDDRHARRQLISERLDGGLVRIVALFEPDEAALVLAAIDARVEAAWRRDRAPERDTPPTELAVRRADALVELATEGLVEGPDPVVRGERIEVRVHVDADVLAGSRDDGVCELEGYGPVAPSIVRRLACDARLATATEQADGTLDLGRTQRTVSRRQRRALQHRDRGCRFPGCAMRRFVDAHHVQPWNREGPTDMDNLVLLCPAHHRLFHEGAYSIDRHGGGRFTFRRPDGRALSPPALRSPGRTGPPPPEVPRATGGGGRFDLDLTLDALVANPAIR